jgi:RimJ/RimL family protein N-acetyltransferase
MATQPGTSDGSQTVDDRIVWVVFEEESPVGLIDVETYGDGSAGLAVVVSPTHRGRGLCARVIRTALEHPRVASVRRWFAGVAVDNHASAHCLGNAGFTRLSDQPDAESMLHYELRTETID